MSAYKPDLWRIIKIDSDQGTHYRVVASFFGSGFLGSDYWKFSSGIEGCIKEDNRYVLPQSSGSTYECYYENQGLSPYTEGIVQDFIKQADEDQSGSIAITLLSEKEAIEYLENLEKENNDNKI